MILASTGHVKCAARLSHNRFERPADISDQSWRTKRGHLAVPARPGQVAVALPLSSRIHHPLPRGHTAGVSPMGSFAGMSRRVVYCQSVSSVGKSPGPAWSWGGTMCAEAAARAQSTESETFQSDRVVTFGAGHAAHDSYTAFLSPLLPIFQDTMALSYTEAGTLSVFLQVPSLLQPFIGYLADRVSLRILVFLTPAITATAMSLLGVAPSYALVAMLLLVAGTSSAILHAVGPVMTGRLSGKSLGRGMGVWMVGGELGRTLGPLLIVAAVNSLSLEGTPWLMIAGWVASFLLYLRLKDVSGRPPTHPADVPWRKALQVMGPILVPIAGIIVVRSFMAVALTTYLPIYLTDEGNALWYAAIALAIFEAAGVVGALLGGALSDRVGRRMVLFLSLLTTPIIMLGFLAADGWVRLPLLVLLGFTSLSVTPVIMALVQESFPENRALANGTYMSLSFVIRSAAVVAIGAIGDSFGMALAFGLSAVIPLLGLPFLRMLPAREK